VLQPDYHRGVAYVTTEIASSLWEWSISPPDSVKGFTPTSGVTAGTRSKAVEAARREIDAQYLNSTSRSASYAPFV
jgi:hypothetical protein